MPYPIGSIIKRRLGGIAGVAYFHMGIYIVDNLVIHFCGEQKKQVGAVIRQDSLQAFAAGQPIAVHAEPKNPEHAQAVIAEASRLCRDSSNPYDLQYDFVWNNCEDFCVACFQVDYA